MALDIDLDVRSGRGFSLGAPRFRVRQRRWPINLRELLEELVPYWLGRADSGEAQPVDLRLAGLIREYGMGKEAANPAEAKAWFGQDAKTRRLAHIRAAQEQIERLQRRHDTIDIDLDIIDGNEHSDYDPKMFDEELRNHLFATVRSGADELKLGLSAKQKEALAQYVVETFEGLVSPSTSELFTAARKTV